MKRSLDQPSIHAAICVTNGRSGLPTFHTLMATLLCLTSQFAVFAQQNPPKQDFKQLRPADSVHFAKSSDCALCHSFSDAASAMRDGSNRNVAAFDLWSGSMMANSAVDPYWKAAASAEVAATPSQKPHIEEVCSRCHAPMAAPITTSPQGQVLLSCAIWHAKAALSRDGVSCTVCHQISSENMGTDISFTAVLGSIRIARSTAAFQSVAMPMQRHVGFTPTKADHILSSAIVLPAIRSLLKVLTSKELQQTRIFMSRCLISSGAIPASMTN